MEFWREGTSERTETSSMVSPTERDSYSTKVFKQGNVYRLIITMVLVRDFFITWGIVSYCDVNMLVQLERIKWFPH